MASGAIGPLLAVGAALGAAAHFWHGWAASATWDLVVAVALLLVAGLAGQKTWNEPRAGGTVLLGLAIAGALRLMLDNPGPWGVFSLGICGALLAAWWKTFVLRRRRPDRPPLVSLVFLLREACELDAERLARKATAAFGTSFAAMDELPDVEEKSPPEATEHVRPPATPSVAGAMPYFVVQNGDLMLAVHLWDGPYYEDAADYAHVREAPVREAIRATQAWLSIDLLAGGPRETGARAAETAFLLVGQLAAAILADLPPDAVLACVHPAAGRAVRFRQEFLPLLRSHQPLRVFDQ